MHFIKDYKLSSLSPTDYFTMPRLCSSYKQNYVPKHFHTAPWNKRSSVQKQIRGIFNFNTLANEPLNNLLLKTIGLLMNLLTGMRILSCSKALNILFFGGSSCSG